MTFVVIYDANALYGNSLRDLLIRLAMTGRVQAEWTNKILDEMRRNLATNRPDISQDKLNKLFRLMTRPSGTAWLKVMSPWSRV